MTAMPHGTGSTDGNHAARGNGMGEEMKVKKFQYKTCVDLC